LKPYVAIIILAILVTLFGFLGIFSAGFFAGIRVAFSIALRAWIILLVLLLAVFFIAARRKESRS